VDLDAPERWQIAQRGWEANVSDDDTQSGSPRAKLGDVIAIAQVEP
jgi:hypothetical protein